MQTPWRFGLIVTGEGERGFLVGLFRSLHTDALCEFTVIRQVGQRSPRKGHRVELRVVGGQGRVPDKDTEQIGLAAYRFLQQEGGDYVILVDDLEYGRSDQAAEVYGRYRAALDSVLGSGSTGLTAHASVHFLVMMLEAYYLADPEAVNATLGTSLAKHAGDVEQIRNPKGRMKQLYPGFDEVADGKELVKALCLDRILADASTCASLRTLVDWCLTAMRVDPSDRYQLRDGRRSDITSSQTDQVRQA
jgi:hypothetical protein